MLLVTSVGFPIGGTIYVAVRIEVQLAWLSLIGKVHSGWADLPCH